MGPSLWAVTRESGVVPRGALGTEPSRVPPSPAQPSPAQPGRAPPRPRGSMSGEAYGAAGAVAAAASSPQIPSSKSRSFSRGGSQRRCRFPPRLRTRRRRWGGRCSALCRRRQNGETGSRQRVQSATGGSRASGFSRNHHPRSEAGEPSAAAAGLRPPPEHRHLLTHRPRRVSRQQPGGKTPAGTRSPPSGKERRRTELGYPQPPDPSRSPAHSLRRAKEDGARAPVPRATTHHPLPHAQGVRKQGTGAVRLVFGWGLVFFLSRQGSLFFFWL